MTKFSTDLRLGIKCMDLIWFFKGFVEKMGKANFGLRDEAQFLQRSDWGKEGNYFDALKQVRWINQTGEELRRARESQEFSLN